MFTSDTDCYKEFVRYCNAIATVLSCVQNYMREMRDECSFVSLRDVERTVQSYVMVLQVDTQVTIRIQLECLL